VDPEYVQPRQRLDGSIVLTAYDAAWVLTYAQLEDAIREALGDTAVEVEHVGSSSVPGLDAKPIIDISLEVPESAEETSYVDQLEALGYSLILREPEWHEHRLLRLPEPVVNLHVFSAGSAEHQKMLAFRDRLRTDDAARDRYLSAKQELARRTWAYVQDYADAKSAVIEEILAD